MKVYKGIYIVILLCCVFVIGCERGQQIVKPVVEPAIEVEPSEDEPIDTVVLSDANLAAAIRETLGLSEDVVLTAKVLEDLSTLEAQDRQIMDLTGLEHAVNLRVLNLNNDWDSETPNQISDITSLANLTQLTGLELDYNQISDITSLANLTQLETLYLSSNQLSDIASLANLTQLEILSLNGNQLSDIASLANLTQLETLYLGSNQLSDIALLANLTQLTWLELGNNQISDISSLANLTQLTGLFPYDNQLSDIASLANLTQLTHLYLDGNQISDIASLANLTQLTLLLLDGNQISDITPLVANTGLGNEDTVTLADNPLDEAARNTHIPALQDRGVTVRVTVE